MRQLSFMITIPLLAACGTAIEEPPPSMQMTPEPQTPEPEERVETEARSITEARAEYETFLDLQVKVIEKTCSPNPGVCHNTNNYPDLRTAGSFLSVVNQACNIEIPDPTHGWDGCERPADTIRAGLFETRVAWIESVGPGAWQLGLEEAPPRSGRERLTVWAHDGSLVLDPVAEWNVNIQLEAGEAAARVSVEPGDAFLEGFIDSALATTVGGDQNRNGVFGADEPMRGAVIKPGQLSESYLWGRVTGTVPGTRMPLANAPLSNAAYAALACWIEGLDAAAPFNADDRIDYDNCAYAEAPLDPAVEDR